MKNIMIFLLIIYSNVQGQSYFFNRVLSFPDSIDFFYYDQFGRYFIEEDSKLYFSKDGSDWKSINAGLPWYFSHPSFFAVIDSFKIITTNNNDFYEFDFNKMFWTRINFNFEKLYDVIMTDNKDFFAAVRFDNPNIITKLFYSNDSGKTWKEISSIRYSWGLRGVKLAFNRGELFYITEKFMEFSPDSGKSWRTLFNYDHREIYDAIFSDEGNLFIQFYEGLYNLSKDKLKLIKVSDVKLPHIIKTKNRFWGISSAIFHYGDRDIFFSDSPYDKWTKASDGFYYPDEPFSICVEDSTRILAATPFYLYRSKIYSTKHSGDNPIFPPRNTFNLSNIFPNPTNDLLNVILTINIETSISIEVYDILGKKVVKLNHPYLKKGENKIKIITDQLSSGIYYLVVSDFFNKSTRKFTVLH